MGCIVLSGSHVSLYRRPSEPLDSCSGQTRHGDAYRSCDSQLNHDAAINVSKAPFTERFTRAILALDQTNICSATTTATVPLR